MQLYLLLPMMRSQNLIFRLGQRIRYCMTLKQFYRERWLIEGYNRLEN